MADPAKFLDNITQGTFATRRTVNDLAENLVLLEQNQDVFRPMTDEELKGAAKQEQICRGPSLFPEGFDLEFQHLGIKGHREKSKTFGCGLGNADFRNLPSFRERGDFSVLANSAGTAAFLNNLGPALGFLMRALAEMSNDQKRRDKHVLSELAKLQEEVKKTKELATNMVGHCEALVRRVDEVQNETSTLREDFEALRGEVHELLGIPHEAGL